MMGRIREMAKEQWKQNQIYYVAFLLPFLAMLIIFMGNRIYPFGDRSFLHVDMYHQYFPFLVELFHKVKEGESLSYSWNAGIGSNFVALYAYYLASPLNWFCLFLPEKFLMEFMSYLVVIKCGLCGLTAAIYLSQHFETKKMSVVLFSTFYGMSGFMAAYNWNVMWLDCIVLAPLIVLGLEKLVKEGKYRLYCISLALAILSNYYICIMICAYLVFYFLLVLLPDAKKRGKAFLNFTWASLLAGGMGALLLIPEALALQLSKFSSATFPENIRTYFTIFDELSRHLLDVEVEIGLDHWPNIYCSVAVLFLVPLYFLCKNIPSKEKLTRGVLLLFLLISFSNNALDFLWHGYNYPDSLPSRQSFLYILCVLTICYEAFYHLKEYSKQELTLSFMMVAAFLLLCQKLIQDEAVTGSSYLFTLLFLAVYALLLYFYKKGGVLDPHLIWMAVLLVFTEALCNMALTSVPTVSRPDYMKNYASYDEMWQQQSKEDAKEFYRYDRKNRVTNNDSMLHDYPSVSMFSSTGNGLVNHFYSQYGMRTSKVFYCSDGMTPFMSSLLSVGYTFGTEELEENPLYSLRQQQEEVCLYQNQYALPMGFCIFPDKNVAEQIMDDKETAFSVVEEGKKDSLLPIPNQNQLGRRLGAKEDLFQEMNHWTDNHNLYATVEENGNVYAYLEKGMDEVIAYADGVEINTYKKLSNNYILDLGYHSAGTELSIYAEEKADFNGELYQLNTKALADLIEELGSNTFQLEEMKADYLRGKVTLKKDGYCIFSIPYDPGFTVLVDGQKTEVALFEDMMLAIPLTEGEHEILLSYRPQGMIMGMTVSVISMIVFFVILFLTKRKKQQKNENL